MRRSVFAITLVVCLLGGTRNLATAGADNGATVTIQPFTDRAQSVCLGEVLAISGTEHLVEQLTIHHDGFLHVQFQFSYQFARAIGETSGKEWIAPGQPFDQVDNLTIDPATGEVISGVSSFINHIKFVGEGRTPDISVTIVEHLMWTDGQLTTERSVTNVHCHA